MKNKAELFSGLYLVGGVAVPHDQLSILGGTDEKPKRTQANNGRPRMDAD